MSRNFSKVHTAYYKPPLITCRVCGHQHYSASVCPVCKTATPSFAVIQGRR